MQFKTLSIMMVIAVGSVVAADAQAVYVTISDANSSVTIDPDGTAADGVADWTVDGVDHLALMGFWYRLSTDTAESPVNSLPKVFQSGGAGFDFLTVAYANSDVDIEVTYLLNGSPIGSMESDLQVAVTITNLTQDNLAIDFFQYADFDLNQTPNAETVEIIGAGNTARQIDANGFEISETVTGPTPDLSEVGLGGGGGALWNKLNDSDIDDLDGSTGPLFGDAAWGFQWSFDVPAGQSRNIGKDLLILVPEPATMVLFGLGAVTMLSARRRKNA